MGFSTTHEDKAKMDADGEITGEIANASNQIMPANPLLPKTNFENREPAESAQKGINFI